MRACAQAAEALAGSVILAAIDPSIAVCLCRALTSEWLPGQAVGDCLYRGSVDGMTPAAFHGACDGKGATLTLIRADEGGRVCVFGGYTSTPWDSRGTPVSCGDAFLFCVTGPHCTLARFPLAPAKASRAILCCPTWGPNFGVNDLGVTSWCGTETGPFDGASNCACFGDPDRGVYTDSVGAGPRTFTGTEDEEGSFTPVEIEVYAVV